MRYLFVVSLCLMAFASCKNEIAEKKELAEASWLIGSWRCNSKNGILVENWRIENDSLYAGSAYFVKGLDTLHQEKMRLFPEKNRLCYEATVQQQNNNQPILFHQDTSQQNMLTFTNPQHNYPQKIVYKKISADSIVVTISGTQEGKASSETYGMQRRNK
jgi:hypothetical protein